MKVVDVPICSKGIDTVTALTEASAKALKQKGVEFVVRYLGGITTAELEMILGEGLGVQLVTFSRAPGWVPSASLGVSDGAADVTRLGALGIPSEMVLWIDLEGSGGDATVTGAWIEGRASWLVATDYVAGLYVGSGCVLDSPQLYNIQNVTRYWRAFNAGIPSLQCGFCQYQLYPPDQVVAGIQIDFDVSCSDYTGRVPKMLVAD